MYFIFGNGSKLIITGKKKTEVNFLMKETGIDAEQ